MGTGVVGREERSDDELSRRDRPDRAADVFDDAAVLVAHGRRTVGGADAAIRPQVGPADARRREPDDGIRRFDNFWRRALLETHVARAVENSSSHDSITHIVYPGFLYNFSALPTMSGSQRCRRCRADRPSLPSLLVPLPRTPWTPTLRRSARRP